MPTGERLRSSFFVGLVAGAAAGLIMLLARLAFAVPTVAELFLDRSTLLIPPRLFSEVLDLLGFAAKPSFLGLIVAGQLLLGGAVGAAYGALVRWSDGQPPRRLAPAFSLAVWLAAVLGVLPLLGVGPFGALLPGGPLPISATLAVAALVYGLGVAALGAWATPAEGLAEGEVESARRRAILKTLGWGALVVAVGGFVVRGAQLAAASASTAQRLVAGGTRLSPEVTPNADFFAVSINAADPVVDLSPWRLVVDGLVERPLSLTYDDLRALPSVEQYLTLECVSNLSGGDLIGNALWRGVSLRSLLDLAGPLPGVRKVWLTAADDYDDSIPLDRALGQGALVAYEMNGEPLPTGHGFPARLLVPGIYGMKSVKWLSRIRLVDYDVKGYWQQRGWSDEALVKTTSRFDLPRARAQYPAGPVAVGGIAYGGDSGIGQVEVSLDGGKSWRPAEVKQALSPYSWVLWTLDWEAPPGQQTLLVRAADSAGHLQEAEMSGGFPEGGTGYHEIVVSIVAPAEGSAESG